MSSGRAEGASRTLTSDSAGLEVVEGGGPQILAHREKAIDFTNDNPREVPKSGQDGLIVVEIGTEKSGRGEDTTATRCWWKRKRVIIIAAVFAVAIIAGAIVGGVLGSRPKKHTEKQEQREDVAPRTASIPSLSVTSLIAPDGYSMLLAYIDRHNNIKYFARNAGDRGMNSSWTISQALGIQKPPFKGSGIAVATLEYGSNVKYSLYYTDESSDLNTWTYDVFDENPQFMAMAQKYNYKTLNNVKIAAYGPWITFPDSVAFGHIIRLTEEQDDTGFPKFGDGVENNKIENDTLPFTLTTEIPSDGREITVEKDGKLVITPLLTNVTDPDAPFSLALFYQTKDGFLWADIYTESSEEIEKEKVLRTIEKSWPSRFPGNLTVAPGCSFSAFATAHATDSTAVNTYILYQDSERDIQVVWAEGGDNPRWQFASPEVMKGADIGTDIACLTMHTMVGDVKQVSNYPVHLRPNSPSRRCFFQRDGSIVEVGINGSGWEVISVIPESDI